MLVEAADGRPLFYPTVFILTQLRATQRTAATIDQALRAIQVLYVVAHKLGIDLDERFRTGTLLALGEIDFLVEMCGLSLDTICAVPVLSAAPQKQADLYKRPRLKRVRSSGTFEPVHPDTCGIRLLYIRSFLQWRLQYETLRLPLSELQAKMSARGADLLCAISARSPRSDSGHLQPRVGLLGDQRQRLLDVTHFESNENPWRGVRARKRNELMVRWLYELGLRRGELLGIRVSDVNFQTNEVQIVKREHDPADPRPRQPNAKTRARVLPLSDDLVDLTRKYVMGVRREIAGARLHEYLFVANGSGAPLSLAALNKTFLVLRQRVQGLPATLSPHVLRHTWNDAFSEMMDAAGVAPQKEEKWRSRLMGWSEQSTSASTYTQRHTQRKATEASLQLQAQMKRARR